MDGKLFARLGAVIFVAVAITATAIELTRKEEGPAIPPPGRAELRSDPLEGELIRCQLLGEAGPRDAACLRAWAENRQRFMAPAAHPTGRLPDTPHSPRRTITQSDSDPIRKEMAPMIAPEIDEVR